MAILVEKVDPLFFVQNPLVKALTRKNKGTSPKKIFKVFKNGRKFWTSKKVPKIMAFLVEKVDPLFFVQNPLVKALTRKNKGTSPKIWNWKNWKNFWLCKTHSLSPKPGRIRWLHQNFEKSKKKKFRKSAFFEAKNEPVSRYAFFEQNPLVKAISDDDTVFLCKTHSLIYKPGRIRSFSLQKIWISPFFIIFHRFFRFFDFSTFFIKKSYSRYP